MSSKKIDGGLFGRDYVEVEKWDGSKEVREVGFLGFSGDKVADVRESAFGGHVVTDTNGNSGYASSSQVHSGSYYDQVASGSLSGGGSSGNSSSYSSPAGSSGSNPGVSYAGYYPDSPSPSSGPTRYTPRATNGYTTSMVTAYIAAVIGFIALIGAVSALIKS